MALIDSYLAFAKNTQAIIVANKASLGIAQIYYGDQDRIPETPTVCVEPSLKRRSLNGVPRRTEVELTTHVIVYHYRLDSPETIRTDNDSLAEQIETLLHVDAQMKDTLGMPTVVDSMVTSIESGYQMKRNSLFRASMLTFEARSQVQLPMSTP